MSPGSAFHSLAAITGKARSQITSAQDFNSAAKFPQMMDSQFPAPIFVFLEKNFLDRLKFSPEDYPLASCHDRTQNISFSRLERCTKKTKRIYSVNAQRITERIRSYHTSILSFRSWFQEPIHSFYFTIILRNFNNIKYMLFPFLLLYSCSNPVPIISHTAILFT